MDYSKFINNLSFIYKLNNLFIINLEINNLNGYN